MKNNQDNPNHLEIAAEYRRLRSVAPDWTPALLRESVIDSFSIKWGMFKDEVTEIVDSYLADSVHFDEKVTDGQVPIKSIIGTFYKQVWGGRKGDDAIASGEEKFDATSAVLLLPLEDLVELEDNSESTDDLGREFVQWDGPCSVHITDSVCEFFGVDGVEEITSVMLEKARSENNHESPTLESITLNIAVKLKVQPGARLDEFIQELDYFVRSKTAGVIVIDTEIVDTDIASKNYERPRG